MYLTRCFDDQRENATNKLMNDEKSDDRFHGRSLIVGLKSLPDPCLLTTSTSFVLKQRGPYISLSTEQTSSMIIIVHL